MDSGCVNESLCIQFKLKSNQPLRYAGYVYDDYSQMYYCAQRYYDPATQVFVSIDPARADAERSGYLYCGGDPVNSTDPSGEAYAVFNGYRFNLYRYLGKSKYKHVGSYRATTGPRKIGYKTKGGPIPPGTWTIRESDWSYSRFSPGNWGPWRARLIANAGTKAYGRGGFFLHSYDGKK